MKILFLPGFLTLGVIYSEKNLVSIGLLQKLCKLFPQGPIYLKSAMLNMQANAALSEQHLETIQKMFHEVVLDERGNAFQ